MLVYPGCVGRVHTRGVYPTMVHPVHTGRYTYPPPGYIQGGTPTHHPGYTQGVLYLPGLSTGCTIPTRVSREVRTVVYTRVSREVRTVVYTRVPERHIHTVHTRVHERHIHPVHTRVPW